VEQVPTARCLPTTTGHIYDRVYILIPTYRNLQRRDPLGE
jgi:hypothetical protein